MHSRQSRSRVEENEKDWTFFYVYSKIEKGKGNQMWAERLNEHKI